MLKEERILNESLKIIEKIRKNEEKNDKKIYKNNNQIFERITTKDEVLVRDEENEKEKFQKSLKIIEAIRKDNEKKSSKNEYDILLKSAIKEFERGNYSSSFCSLTSIIDNHKNIQNQLLVFDTKFWLAKIYEKGLGFKNNEKNQAFNYYEEVFNSNSKFKENARNQLIICYSQGIGIRKDNSKADKLYERKEKIK
ncbi:hypothetical protein C2G38_2218643 [Gigaspora rosea]|uniref:Uncharacterized protein n=1 Tax=Gigaspora rosea TaxID=44941 RepID=A0A397UAN4_9GLOM|nr:hypothetical protein C2G38_2218643 [Gigaspora rosea]